MIFALGNFTTKIISFFLIPLYTNALTTSEYGTVDLVATISTIAVPLLSLNISEAVMRFNLDKNAEQNKITKIGIRILLCGLVLGMIIIPICNIFDSISAFSIQVYFYVIFSASSQLFLADLRGKEKLIQYSFGNIINTLLLAIFNILFLLVLDMGINGYLLAYTLSFAAVTFYALIIGKGYKSIRDVFDIKICRKMLKYSIVLIPNSFMWWIINSSDHIMVTSMVGVAANGIYAIAYKLPTLISSVMQVFNQAWSYSAIKEEGASDESEYNNKILKYLIMSVMIIGIFMMAAIKPFLKIYVTSDYYSAWRYTPFLIIGCVYLTLASFMATSYTVHKDSYGFLFSSLFGAILNIVLNFILIPYIEIYGAALATCVSYISVFAFRVIHTRKYIKYNALNKELRVGTLMMVISGILMYVDNIAAQIIQICMALVIIILFYDAWLPVIIKIVNKLRISKYKKCRR